MNSNNSQTLERVCLPSLARMQDSLVSTQNIKMQGFSRPSLTELDKQELLIKLNKRLGRESELMEKNMNNLKNWDDKLAIIEMEIELETAVQEEMRRENEQEEDRRNEIMKNIQFELDEISNIEKRMKRAEEEMSTMQIFKDVKGSMLEQLVGDYSAVLEILMKSKKPKMCDLEREFNSNKTRTKKSRFYTKEKSNKVSTFNNGGLVKQIDS